MNKQTFGERPRRLSQIFNPYPLYFVTFCTHRRRRCLASAEVHAAFVQFGTLAHNQFNIAIGQYVIMPDHVHLFVRGADEFVLGRWSGTLKQALAKAANFSRTVGQIWQEGFFDHVLRSDESYARKREYVHQNPVRAGLVKLAEDWPYQGEIVRIDRA
jgi:putative transposase